VETQRVDRGPVEHPSKAVARSATDLVSPSSGSPDAARESERPVTSFAPIARWGLDPLRIVVIDRTSGKPVPGAAVFYMTEDSRIFQFALDGDGWIGPDPEATVREHGHTVRADERGEVDISTSHEAWLVCARSNDLFGWARFQACMAGEQQLLVEPQTTLAVHVVDDLGNPCSGIRVGLCRGPQNRNDWEDDTDAAGNVRVHNFALVLRDAFLAEERAVEVHAEFPSDPPIAVWIDPNHPPNEPVQLKLPACGRLHMHVLDPAGQILHARGTAAIGRTPAPGVVHDPKRPRFYARIEFEDAAAIDLPIALGAEFDVSVDLDVGGGAMGRVKGPRTRGEIVVAELSSDPSLAFVSGRIVDERSMPVAKSALHLQKFSFHDGSLQDESIDTLRTDAEGRFEIPRPGDMAWIVVQAPARERRAALLDLRKRPRSPLLELGDIRLSRLSPLVHGRLEDEEGYPIAGGGVHLTLRRSSTDRRVVIVGSDYPTDASGEFAIYGPCAEGTFSLDGWSEHDRHRSKMPGESFACGEPAREHVLRFETLGAIEGSALLDAGRDSREFKITLEQGTNYNFVEGSIVGGAYRFEILGVSRGTHTLSVEGGSAAVSQVPGIVVEAGKTTHDPRLEPLDLRGVLPRVAAEIVTPVVDSSGRSIPFGTIWFLNDADDFYRERWANGRVHVPSSGVIAVEVSAPGHRVAHAELNDLRQPIVLGSACDVAITLDRPRSLVDAGVNFVAVLRPLDESKTRHAIRELLDGIVSSAQFDESGEARFHLSIPGQFELTVRLVQLDPLTGTVTNAWSPSVEGSCARVDVNDRDGQQQFDARLDPEGLREVIDTVNGTKKGR
jgi:hypothetical protein